MRRRFFVPEMADEQITTKPMQSQAQWRYLFASGKPFAERWAKATPGGKGRRFRRLPIKKKAYSLDEFTAIALKEESDPIAVSAAAAYTPSLSSLKAEQLAPGVSRIHGDLCNVHGRWGSCRAAGYGGAPPPSKRVAPKKLPNAPKPKAGGKKGVAGKKGGAARKPIKTDAQREQERQQKRAQAQQQRVAEHEQNKAKVLHDLGIPEDAAGALADLSRGLPIDDDGGLVKMGLADQGKDRSYRLTGPGRAFLAAAESGDAGRARDALGRARDQQAGQEERAAAQADRKRAADERHAAIEAKRAEAARLRAERLAKQGKGGGGKGKKPTPPAPPKPPSPPAPRSSAPPRVVGGGGGSRNAPQQPPKPKAPALPQALVDAAQALSDGRELDEPTTNLLIRNGLAKRNKEGVLVLTAAGQRATKKEQAATKAANPDDYLVVEDRTKPSTYHLQVRRNGKPDHGLMGAAWAALHGGYRGNTYAGPQKAEALTKLKRLYEQESMPLPSEKSFAVFKDASGAWRWISRTTTAFEDRDEEVISTKALEADCTRADTDHRYGPLRWWHVGRPDPLNTSAPWGPGIDLGWCDFNAVSGRTLIESGTFKTEAIARAVAAHAADLELSPGFFHAIGEPDASGVFHHIRRFERSLVPKWAGRASNPYTGLVVEKTMDQKKIDALKVLGVPEATVKELIADVERTEKAADTDGVRYKEENPIKDFFSRLLRGEQVVTKEETVEETPAATEPEPHVDDPLATLKEELASLRAEIASLKAPAPMMDAEDDPALGGDAGVDEAAEGEPPMDSGADTGDGGLTLSTDDLAAIGQMFGGVLSSALEPLVGALGITQKLDGHMTELKNLMGGYVKQKEAGDTERADTITALKATIDQQQAAITESQAKLTELLGDQPRAAGYRPTQAADNGAEALIAAIKDGPDGAPAGDFDDIIANLFPGLAQGGK